MSRILQIRGLPDDVHDALRDEARARGQSLTKFVAAELEHVARRAAVSRQNAAVIRRVQADLGGPADRASILKALHDGRDE